VKFRRALILVSLAALVALPTAAVAADAVVIGQPATNASSCTVEMGAQPTVIQQAVFAGSDYTAPSAGVITSFSSWLSDVATFRGLVLRATGATQYSLVAKSPSGTGTGTVTIPTRITVQVGDKIALQALNTVGKAWCTLASPGASSTRSLPVGDFDPDTDTVADFSGAAPVGNQSVNLSAQLEADADGDGYGDVTQDLCPTSAATQAACPGGTTPPGTTPPGTNPPGTTAKAPETTLVGTVKKKVTKKAVVLRFTSPTAGATFRCQVDKAPAATCASPYRHKYKLGKHTVTIAAVDPATGLADTTPLVVKFKVKPKR
jgi:hypothetical protein